MGFEGENWMLVGVILAVPVVLFAVIEVLRQIHARKARIVSSRSKLANRRR